MANWAKGLAAGFESGVRLGDVLEQRQIREALAREAAKYTPTEGAYGPELSQNIEQLRGLQQQNPEQAAQYEPAIAELTRRQGLTAPDYSIGSGAQNYATRQEALQAAAPMRAQGLANVYRQYGDVERADAAETRAMQAEAAGLSIRKGKREENEDLARLKRQEEDATWWKSRLTGEDGTQRAPGPEDFMAASQRNVASYLGAGKLDQAGTAFREYMTTARGQIELQNAERGEAIKGAVQGVLQGNLNAAKEFYHKYVPNGAMAKDFKMDDKGVITIQQVDLNGKALPPTKLTRDELIQGLASFNDPVKLVEFTQRSFMNNLHAQQLQETKRHNLAAEGLSAQRLALDKKGPLATTIDTLRKNNIDVNEDMIKSLAGLNKEDNALLKAQTDAILKGIDPMNKDSVTNATAQINEVFKLAAVRKQQGMVQDAARKAYAKGDLEGLVKELRAANVTDDVIAAQLRAANVPIPPELIPPAEPGLGAGPRGPSWLSSLLPGGGTYRPSGTFGLSN